MGILDKVRDAVDRDKAHPDELSPFADEEPDEVTSPDGDDSILGADNGGS